MSHPINEIDQSVNDFCSTVPCRVANKGGEAMPAEEEHSITLLYCRMPSRQQAWGGTVSEARTCADRSGERVFLFESVYMFKGFLVIKYKTTHDYFNTLAPPLILCEAQFLYLHWWFCLNRFDSFG